MVDETNASLAKEILLANLRTGYLRAIVFESDMAPLKKTNRLKDFIHIPNTHPSERTRVKAYNPFAQELQTVSRAPCLCPFGNQHQTICTASCGYIIV